MMNSMVSAFFRQELQDAGEDSVTGAMVYPEMELVGRRPLAQQTRAEPVEARRLRQAQSPAFDKLSHWPSTDTSLRQAQASLRTFMRPLEISILLANLITAVFIFWYPAESEVVIPVVALISPLLI
ncbi:MAG: hypothetical protein M5U34_30120 [Chloroflexi bacterium]|nr:hypothetical protein [Chloroflexota bacterium]